MMKIGLLTFHDTNNFGSYLQTYGLYKKVIELGCDCEIIDYKCQAIHERENYGKYHLDLNPKHIIAQLLFNGSIRTKYKNLMRWLKENSSLSNSYSISNIKMAANKKRKGVREIMDALDSIADEYDKALSSMDVGNLTDEDWRGIEGELGLREIQDFVSYDSAARRIKPRSDEEIAKRVMTIRDTDIVKVRVRTERARKKAETFMS